MTLLEHNRRIAIGVVGLNLLASLLFSVVPPASAKSPESSNVSSDSSVGEESIGSKHDRCLLLARTPHWTDSGWTGVPSGHRQGWERLCDLANNLLADDAGAVAAVVGGREREVLDLPPVSRPSAFAAACREEAHSGPRSLRALNWRNSPHQSAKMALCDQYERALVANYFDGQLR